MFAFQEIHEGDPLGSMFYGDTISFTHNFPRNMGVVGEYLLWDILAQLESSSGHAVHPLPITEAGYETVDMAGRKVVMLTTSTGEQE